MNDRLIVSLNMTRRVLTLLRTTDRTSGLAKLPPRVTQLGSLVEEINALGEAQTRPTQGTTEARDAVLKAMKEAALDLASAVALHAADAKRPELLRKVEIYGSDFDGLRLGQRPWLASRIVDTAASVLPALAPEVTAETLEQAREKISAAEAALDNPRIAISEKASATRRLETVFQEVAETLAQIDRLIFPLRKTEPDFYADYRAARRLLDRRSAGAAKPATSEAASPATVPAAAPLARAA
jgi:hypothetical protein